MINGHDLVISAYTAKFGMPEVIRGSYGATATPSLFHAGIPFKKAFFISLTGRNLTGVEAERVGLVSQVVPEQELDGYVETLTKELASRIGEPEFSALYHQGKGAHVFMNGVDENTILLTVFSEKTTVGLIRFYSANCARKLQQILDRLRSEPRRDRFTFSASDIQKAGRLFGR